MVSYRIILTYDLLAGMSIAGRREFELLFL